MSYMQICKIPKSGNYSQKHAISTTYIRCTYNCKLTLYTCTVLSISFKATVLELYDFYPPEPKCITQSKSQRSQLNFTVAPEPRSGLEMVK